MRTIAALSVMLSTAGCTPPTPRQPVAGLQGLRASVEAGIPPVESISFLRSKNAGGITVIWVHGTPGDAEGWTDYVLDPLPGTVSVALDRPGFGDSTPMNAVTSLDQQAAAVAVLFPAVPQQVVLVGHSLGGAVVARVAALHPDRVRGLVLLASSLDPAQESIHPMQYVGRMWPVSSMLSRALRNANEELMALKDELLALQPLLALITAPTVIVHGTKDDLVPLANVAYMQAHLTGARSVKTMVLEGQNHFLPWNSQVTVREAVEWAMAHSDSPDVVH